MHKRRTHRRRRRNPVGRRRRGGGGGGGGASNPLAAAKQLVSKDTLMVAGGAVLGTMVSSFILSRYGPMKLNAAGQQVAKGPTEFKLPGSDSRYGPLLYSLLFPVVGAYALQKAKQPQLARGMVIGGAVLLLQSVVSIARSSMATAGVGSYLNAGGTIRSLPTPGYSAVKAFSGVGNALDSGSAFRANTWAVAR